MKNAEYNLFKDFDLTVKIVSIDTIDDQFVNLYFRDLAGVIYRLKINLS